MKRVVLTGSTGLIGKEAIKPLEDLGFEVFCLTSKNCNLFDEVAVQEFFKEVKPQYLLHFAWYTKEGYLESDLNPKYVEASLNMLKIFKNNGGKRAIFAGTCFEYRFKDEPLKETDELNPQSLYAKCKCELREKAEKYSEENDISFGWGRIFYVFGRNEHPNRFTSYIINNLKSNKPVEIKYGQLIKDYMYTKDIAAAFVKFLDSEVKGCVNICTGNEISLSYYATMIAEKLEKEDFLEIKNETTSQPSKIIGDNTRLIEEVGYTIQYNLKNALEEIFQR